MEKIMAIGICVAAAALVVIAAVAVTAYVRRNRKCARVEGKMSTESRRLVWRIVNKGRDITLVEIGIRCADKQVSYRPLRATDDIDPLPMSLARGEIASYRKEIERFAFRQNEIDELKISNPNICFYAKDAEGTVYTEKSEYKFAQYLTNLIGGGK